MAEMVRPILALTWGRKRTAWGRKAVKEKKRATKSCSNFSFQRTENP